MSKQKIISIKKYQKSKKKSLMFFIVILAGGVLGLISWHYLVEGIANLDVKIPESQNIVFNQDLPIAMTTTQIANEFENADGKPILLYIYTTWCKICANNFSTINEIAREFQNTELQVITLAIDRNMTTEGLRQYLNGFGNVFFQPRFLGFKDGFIDFLQQKNIHYNNRIPFTVIISRDGDVVKKFSGTKSKEYLRNKIIKELYNK
jgi:thiol-disulfide isomerase/thioredoxin